jgi:RNA polymerase sigma factor (sigma-70 family)
MSSTTTSAPQLLGDEADLFLAHHEPLQRYIARAVPGHPAAVEEACAYAWTELVRRQPDRDRIVAWLAVVARHEAIRLARRARREPCIADPRHTPLWSSSSDLTRTLDTRAALQLVATLPARKRAVLGMRIGGHSHAEIAGALQMTPRTVQRQLTRARAAVMALAIVREHGT